LAKKCCLIPRDDIQAGYADMYVHYFTEMFDLISSYTMESVIFLIFYLTIYLLMLRLNDKNKKFQDAALKQSKYNTLVNTTWPLFLSRVEARIIANNGCGVIAGWDISYADLYLVSVLDFYKTQFSGNLDAYPNVKALDARVRALPKVAAWLSTRPITSF
jgi:glutathione S-transferase